MDKHAVGTRFASDAPGDGYHVEPQGPDVTEGAQMSGVAEVMVSNFPDFTGGVWVPLVGGNVEFTWSIDTDEGVTEQGEDFRATVYVKFRDAAGNESDVTQDSIWVNPQGGGEWRLMLPMVQRQ